MFSLAVLPFALAGAWTSVLQEPIPIPSRVETVVVSARGARVQRSARLPSGGGAFLLNGLPGRWIPSSLRVRAFGGEILSASVRPVGSLGSIPRDRFDRTATALLAEDEVFGQLVAELDGLLAEPVGMDAGTGWVRRLGALLSQRRELEDALADLRGGEPSPGTPPPLLECVLEVRGHEARGVEVEFDYVVAAAGWEPCYALEIDGDLSHARLGVHARVWQQTGEDWNGVALTLIRGEPVLEPGGPEPFAPRLELVEETSLPESSAVERHSAHFAELEGVSEQWTIEGAQTIASNSHPSRVLLAEAQLNLEPHYHCAPAADPRVWLRASAINSTSKVLHAGEAEIYLGGDLVGIEQLGPASPGQRFTFGLGPDDGWKLTRTCVQDDAESPGLRQLTWRLRIRNEEARLSDANGRARVLVREALPRSADRRVTVELDFAEPAPSNDGDLQKDREQRGILSWPVDVPRGSAVDIVYTAKIRYPQEAELSWR